MENIINGMEKKQGKRSKLADVIYEDNNHEDIVDSWLESSKVSITSSTQNSFEHKTGKHSKQGLGYTEDQSEATSKSSKALNSKLQTSQKRARTDSEKEVEANNEEDDEEDMESKVKTVLKKKKKPGNPPSQPAEKQIAQDIKQVTTLSSTGSESEMRKRKKTRSKQKNIRKDNRIDELKPPHLRLGSKDYRGRPLSEVRFIQHLVNYLVMKNVYSKQRK